MKLSTKARKSEELLYLSSVHEKMSIMIFWRLKYHSNLVSHY